MWGFRPSSERGQFDHGWLRTSHTFSFAGYRDPKWMGFRSLRVINDDYVDPNHGFGTHGHADMEIISLVLGGSLEHRDSMGNGAVLKPGDVQYMSAGSGIRHSERNPSVDEEAHFYQVWIEPNEESLPPVYDQRKLQESPGWQLLASPDGRDNSMMIRQNAVLRYAGGSEPLTLDVEPGRAAWVQVLKGSGSVAGRDFDVGDGFFTETAGQTELQPNDRAELLWFDLGE